MQAPAGHRVHCRPSQSQKRQQQRRHQQCEMHRRRRPAGRGSIGLTPSRCPGSRAAVLPLRLHLRAPRRLHPRQARQMTTCRTQLPAPPAAVAARPAALQPAAWTHAALLARRLPSRRCVSAPKFAWPADACAALQTTRQCRCSWGPWHSLQCPSVLMRRQQLVLLLHGPSSDTWAACCPAA